jgi:IS30 family transposase
VHSAEHLEFVSAEMNERPRKTLDWDEPREVLAKLLLESSRQPAVASTD